ncbi:Uncharacterised protein [Acinetobacter baumannii]|nr:Uncharacterised protein [Acinetobacter baumannii]
MDSSFPASFACNLSLRAADNPAGPAPTIRTSHSIVSRDCWVLESVSFIINSLIFQHRRNSYIM